MKSVKAGLVLLALAAQWALAGGPPSAFSGLPARGQQDGAIDIQAATPDRAATGAHRPDAAAGGAGVLALLGPAAR
jgi:hypothetical protein